VQGSALGTLQDADDDDDDDDGDHQEQVEKQKTEITQLTHQVTTDYFNIIKMIGIISGKYFFFFFRSLS